jgi:hypothetical protein
MFHPEKKPVFLDYQSWDDMNFCERKLMHLELALGMASEENQLQRQQIIMQTQQGLSATVTQLVSSGVMTPEMYKKIKKPYEDTLYVLGIKDCNTYLPTDEEVMKMVQQAQAAGQNKEPSPADKKDLSVAELNAAKATQIKAEIEGQDAESQLDFMAMAQGNPKVYN